MIWGHGAPFCDQPNANFISRTYNSSIGIRLFVVPARKNGWGMGGWGGVGWGGWGVTTHYSPRACPPEATKDSRSLGLVHVGHEGDRQRRENTRNNHRSHCICRLMGKRGYPTKRSRRRVTAKRLIKKQWAPLYFPASPLQSSTPCAQGLVPSRLVHRFSVWLYTRLVTSPFSR